MKKHNLTSALIIILFINLSFYQSAFSQNGSRELANLDEYIVEQMEISHVPGLSACIVIGDSLVWNNNYGFANLEENEPVTDSTLFAVFSIGKSVTAATFMQISENGGMGVDQNVNDVLPFSMMNPWNSQDSITPRMIMCHSSSISDNYFDGFITIGDATMELGYYLESLFSVTGQYYSNENYYNCYPGTQYHYSNNGPALVGFIVETVTGENYRDYSRDSILTPLEMLKSGWLLGEINTDNLAIGYDYESGSFQPNPFIGHPAYPAIMLRSSAIELSNYLRMLLNQGEFEGQEILSSFSVTSMTTVQNPTWGGSFGTPGLGLYYREDYGDRSVWGHNGGSVGGYAAQLYFCEDENTGIVITTNSNQYIDQVVERMFDYAAMIVIPEEVTNITETGFTLNWQSAPAAVSYRIDISDNYFFSSFIEGYEDLDVGLVTSFDVNGLECGSDHYCRIRSFNGEEPGPNSSLIHATTDPCVGIEDQLRVNNDELRIKVFPNPTGGIFNVQLTVYDFQRISICLIDIEGKEVSCLLDNFMTIGRHVVTFDLSSLTDGIYALRFNSGQGIITEKLIKL